MEITATSLKKVWPSKNIILLDVREPYEIAEGSIRGSLKIPMNEIPDSLDKLDKSKGIVVYCRSGHRSAYVTKFLAEKGYKAKNLAGGYLEWKRIN